MKAAVLEDVEKLVVRDVPTPRPGRGEVLLRVAVVGVCGTDLHLYRGHANYRLDARGRKIPLHEQPQVLGHEFGGRVEELGPQVTDLRPGDRVLCDQGRNCHSQGRQPLCLYCASGDSHQCEYYQEHGITGPPGALAEYIVVPAVNCLKIPEDMTLELGALVEPLGCVFHSSDLVDRARARFSFHGPERIRNVLICGAGPAGLLFLQLLRNVKRFEGQILISDLREKNLELARQFGGTPLNVAKQELIEAVREATHGEKIHYLIEACGNSIVFEQMPFLLRKQATVLLYAHGYKGRDLGLLSNILFLEPTLVAGVGASGGFDEDHRPKTYRRSMELVHSGQVKVLPYVTHRYQSLEDIHLAFERDFDRPNYIKGVLCLSE